LLVRIIVFVLIGIVSKNIISCTNTWIICRCSKFKTFHSHILNLIFLLGWLITHTHRSKVVIHICKWIGSIVVSFWHLLNRSRIRLWCHHLSKHIILLWHNRFVLFLLFLNNYLRFNLWNCLHLRLKTRLRWSYVLHLGSYWLLHWWLLLRSLIELRLLLLAS